MARAFGDGHGEDEKLPKGSPDPSQGAAASKEVRCNAVDERDSDSSLVSSNSRFCLEDEREVAAEGQHLYLDFFRTEMERRGLETELDCFDSSNREVIPSDLVDPARLMDWTRAGRELRQLADAFSRSKERQTVRKRAQSVALDSLDSSNFLQLLQELFHGGGITRERILVLFFFCADVAIEALRRGFHRTFHELVKWTLSYISTNVAQYVHSLGGWGVVLRHSLDIAYQFTACCAFVAVVAACMVYIKRNLN